MLQNKTIVVTGASGVLGACLVNALLARGAHVVACDLIFSGLRDALPYGLEIGERLQEVEIDISDEQQVGTLFEKIESVDGVVNCAYPRNESYGEGALSVSLKSFNENVNLQLGTAFLLMQNCARYFELKKTPISVVNIGSIYGITAPRFDVYKDTDMTMPVEYAAVKSAINHLSKYFIKLVSDSKFRVNVVSPGGIFVNQPEVFVRSYKAQTLGTGMLEASDVVGAIIFLLSDGSSMVNGQNIIVDDGFVL